MELESRRSGWQVRRLLIGGFGGLLLLLALSGINALSVLGRIQTRNESIREDYVNRDLILEELRSEIYLSGTYVRDLLVEPDPSRADSHRMELNATRSRIEATIDTYERNLRGEEKAPFEQFRREVGTYFNSLHPALQWNADQRRQLGYAFMRDSLLPRRMTIVRLADQIGALNQKQLDSGNQRVADLFSTFRRDLIALLIVSLLGGLLLAGGSFYRIARLEQLSTLRFDEILQARGALRDLSARLVEVQETERRALSRELHDEVGQALSALLLALGNLAALIPQDTPLELRAQLMDTRRLAEKTVAVVRDICLLLRPSMLDDLGLLPALEWQAREISRTHSLLVNVQAGTALEDLPDDQKTCIYRVVQEALRNVVRHAKAKHASIKLLRDNYALRLSIEDDGQGFSPEREKGVGLLGMEERVRHLDGTFRVVSKLGQGTVIEISLPALALSSQTQ